MFYNTSTQSQDTGFIEEILTLELQGISRNFFIMRPHVTLSAVEENQAPFIHLDPRYSTKIVDCALAEKVVIIELHHIITHLTAFQRPTGTYGIQKKTLVICWALNRGLK